MSQTTAIPAVATAPANESVSIQGRGNNRILSDNAVKNESIEITTTAPPEKAKTKRVIRKIDFKTLQQSGLDRKIAEAIYRQKNLNKNSAEIIATTSATKYNPCTVKETETSAMKSQTVKNAGIIELTSLDSCNQRTQKNDVIKQDTRKSVEQAKDLLHKKMLETQKKAKHKVSPSKLFIHLKPPAAEVPKKKQNLKFKTKESSLYKDSINDSKDSADSNKPSTLLRKPENDRTPKFFKDQPFIPKASIKPLQERPSKSPKILKEVDCKSIKKNKSAPSANVTQKTAVKSLIVLENKVLSHDEMIDLTSLRLPTTNVASCSELALAEEEKKDNSGNHVKYYKPKKIQEEVNQTKINQENVTGLMEKASPLITKISRVTQAPRVLRSSYESIKLESIPKHSRNEKSISISSEKILTPQSIQSSHKQISPTHISNVSAASKPTLCHKSAVEILRKPNAHDTISAVDFLASFITSNNVSNVMVSQEELNLSASFGQNLSQVKIEKKPLPNEKSSSSNCDLQIGNIITIQPDHIFVLDSNKLSNMVVKRPETVITESVDALLKPMKVEQFSQETEKVLPKQKKGKKSSELIIDIGETPKTLQSLDVKSNQGKPEVKEKGSRCRLKPVTVGDCGDDINLNTHSITKPEFVDSSSTQNNVKDSSEVVNDLNPATKESASKREETKSIAELKSNDIVNSSEDLNNSREKFTLSMGNNDEQHGEKGNLINISNNFESDKIVNLEKKETYQRLKESTRKVEESSKSKRFKRGKINLVPQSTKTLNCNNTSEASSGTNFTNTIVKENISTYENNSNAVERAKSTENTKESEKAANTLLSVKNSEEPENLSASKNISSNDKKKSSKSVDHSTTQDEHHKKKVEKNDLKNPKKYENIDTVSTKLLTEKSPSILSSNPQSLEGSIKIEDVKLIPQTIPIVFRKKDENSSSEKVNRKKDRGENNPLKENKNVTYSQCLREESANGSIKKELKPKGSKSVDASKFAKSKQKTVVEKNIEDNPNKTIELKKEVLTECVKKEKKALDVERPTISSPCTEKKPSKSFDKAPAAKMNLESHAFSKFSSKSIIESESEKYSNDEFIKTSQRKRLRKTVEAAPKSKRFVIISDTEDSTMDDNIEFLGFEDTTPLSPTLLQIDPKENNKLISHDKKDKKKDVSLKLWLTSGKMESDTLTIKNPTTKPLQNKDESESNLLKKRRDLNGISTEETDITDDSTPVDDEEAEDDTVVVSGKKRRLDQKDINNKDTEEQSNKKKRKSEVSKETSSLPKEKAIVATKGPIMKQQEQQNINPITSTVTFGKRGRARKLEISFNPRLLLITKREQLNTDEVLTHEVGAGGTGNAQCGLCLNYIPSEKWVSHLGEHYGVGWRVGDPEMNVRCRSTILTHMIAYYKETQIKGLCCRMCHKLYRSALGLLMHIETCGVPMERFPCDYCKQLYAKSSLGWHIRTCLIARKRNSCSEPCEDVEKASAPVEEQINNSGRVKRVSTLKAESKLKILGAHLTNTATEEDIKSHIEHVPSPMVDDYLMQWRKDMDTFGKAFCPKKICKFTSSELSALGEHIKSCKYIQKQGYYCNFCKNKCFDNLDSAVKHIKQKHREKNSNSDNSDYNIKTDEENSNESDDDSNLTEVDEDEDLMKKDNNTSKKSSRKKRPKKKTNTSSVASSITVRKRVFCNRRYDLESSISQKWLYFIKLNYSLVPLFSHYAAKYVVNDAEELSKYLPSQLNSMKFAFSKGLKMCKSVGIPDPEIQWSQLKRFESFDNDNEVFLFCGAPVKALYWLPLPSNVNEQYLAVIYRKDIFKYTRIIVPKQISTAVLLFKVNHLSRTKAAQVQLHYAVSIVDGPIHDLSFLPSGGYDGETNRLSLMAVASISNTINIYALPINVEADASAQNSVPILELKPVFSLNLEMEANDDNDQLQYKAQCLKICWSEAIGHNHIFASFGNGFIGIWDITDDAQANLNRFERDGMTTYVPLNYWYVGESCIKQLDVHYDTNGPRWIVAAGKLRRFIVYDVRDFMQPLIVKCDIQHSIIRSVEWPPMYETFLLGLCDSIMHHGHCIFVVNPVNIYFSQNKFHTMLSSVTQTHYTPLTNLCVSSTDNGDILFVNPKELNSDATRKYIGQRRNICTMDVKSLHGKPLNKLTAETEELPDDFNMFDASYKDKYGVVFGSVFKLNEKYESLYLNEKRRPPVTVIPSMRINGLRCNLNISAKNLIAAGYENGFIRIFKFNKKHYFE